MISTSTTVSAATLGLAALLVWFNVKSWRTTPGRPLSIFADGAQGTLGGSSLALCTGGVFGWFASLVGGAANTVAGVIPWATNTQDQAVASGTTTGLTIWGGVVAFIIVATYVLTVRALLGSSSGADKTRRNRLIGGLVVGVCLTYTAGVANLVNSYQIPAYNSIGDLIPTGIDQLGGLA